MILVKPDLKYYEQYKEMMDEWNMEESRIAPWPLSLKYHTMDYYKDMLKRVEGVRNGIDLDGGTLHQLLIGYMMMRKIF